MVKNNSKLNLKHHFLIQMVRKAFKLSINSFGKTKTFFTEEKWNSNEKTALKMPDVIKKICSLNENFTSTSQKATLASLRSSAMIPKNFICTQFTSCFKYTPKNLPIKKDAPPVVKTINPLRVLKKTAPH